MPYNHGIRILENPTSIVTPLQSDADLQVVVGTAPIHLATDPSKAVNTPIVAYKWSEAVEKLGYSTDWDKYTLCQSMYATFQLVNVAPIVFINVLDPDKHATQVTDVSHTITDSKFTIENTGVPVDGVLLSTIVVKNATTTAELDNDYVVAFDDKGHVTISILATGALSAVSTVTVSYKVLDPTLVDDLDIIGGYNATKKQNEGLEVVSDVFPKLGLVPGQIVAPGWSHKPTISAVMSAKSQNINECFNAETVKDIDVSTVTSYDEAPAWKNTNGYTQKDATLCYLKVKVGDISMWMSALQAAVKAFKTANNEAIPSRSPSNTLVSITGTVLSDGTEVLLDKAQANYLNSQGIVTMINFMGWRTWGNNKACYPANTDVKDRFINIRSMFNWWGNSFILTYFQKVDDNADYRLIESVVDSENARANGFVGSGQVAGAQMKFRRVDNPIPNILNGSIKFEQKLAFWTPAEDIANVLEFDPTMLQSALGGE